MFQAVTDVINVGRFDTRVAQQRQNLRAVMHAVRVQLRENIRDEKRVRLLAVKATIGDALFGNRRGQVAHIARPSFRKSVVPGRAFGQTELRPKRVPGNALAGQPQFPETMRGDDVGAERFHP